MFDVTSAVETLRKDKEVMKGVEEWTEDMKRQLEEKGLDPVRPNLLIGALVNFVQSILREEGRSMDYVAKNVGTLVLVVESLYGGDEEEVKRLREENEKLRRFVNDNLLG